MEDKSCGKKPAVHRVTIDVRLDASYFQLMVAKLWRHHEDVPIEDNRSWARERLVYVDAEKLNELFGTAKPELARRVTTEISGRREEPSQRSPVPPWHALAEGQVYIIGEFRVRLDDDGEPASIATEPGHFDVLRIDRLTRYKEHERRLYSAAVRASEV